MKKYTTPEVEVIKFQAMETIADNLLNGSLGAGDYDPDVDGDLNG